MNAPRDSVGFPPTVHEHQFRLIGISKLFVGVNVSVNRYLSLCVCLALRSTGNLSRVRPTAHSV